MNKLKKTTSNSPSYPFTITVIIVSFLKKPLWYVDLWRKITEIHRETCTTTTYTPVQHDFVGVISRCRAEQKRFSTFHRWKQIKIPLHPGSMPLAPWFNKTFQISLKASCRKAYSVCFWHWILDLNVRLCFFFFRFSSKKHVSTKNNLTVALVLSLNTEINPVVCYLQYSQLHGRFDGCNSSQPRATICATLLCVSSLCTKLNVSFSNFFKQSVSPASVFFLIFHSVFFPRLCFGAWLWAALPHGWRENSCTALSPAHMAPPHCPHWVKGTDVGYAALLRLYA